MTLYVNGQAVAQAAIEDEINRLRPRYEQVFHDQHQEQRQLQLAEWARENVIEAVLFRQEARKAFAAVTEEHIQAYLERLLGNEDENGPIHQQMQEGPDRAARLREDIAEQIRHDRLTERITAAAQEPADKHIRNYYNRHINRFTVPEMVHAAHIVKHPNAETPPEEARRQIEAVYRRLQEGASFEELARQHSDCPDGGGDLGFFARGRMVAAFEEAAFSLKPGTYSPPFETEFGWHIAKVLEKRPGAPCPLEQVRPVIVRDLMQQAREKLLENFLDTCRQAAVIQDRPD